MKLEFAQVHSRRETEMAGSLIREYLDSLNERLTRDSNSMASYQDAQQLIKYYRITVFMEMEL